MKASELIGVCKRLHETLQELHEVENVEKPAIIRKNKIDEVNAVMNFFLNERGVTVMAGLESVKSFLILNGEDKLAESIVTLAERLEWLLR